MDPVLDEINKRIIDKLPHLTESQKTIANFIIENPRKFALHSVRELEGKLQLSKSTIVRFAQALGYDGFVDMKSTIVKSLRDDSGPIPRYKKMLSGVQKPGNFIDLFAAETFHNIDNTLKMIDYSQYEKVLELLKKADKVYTIGFGISQCLSEIASYMLSRVSINSHGMTYGPLRFTEQIINISEKDVILAFSFPPYSQETIEAARYANERKIKVVSITDKVTNEILKYCDAFLRVSVESISISNSIISTLILLYAIITQLSFEMKDKTLKEIEALEYVRKERLY